MLAPLRNGVSKNSVYALLSVAPVPKLLRNRLAWTQQIPLLLPWDAPNQKNPPPRSPVILRAVRPSGLPVHGEFAQLVAAQGGDKNELLNAKHFRTLTSRMHPPTCAPLPFLQKNKTAINMLALGGSTPPARAWELAALVRELCNRSARTGRGPPTHLLYVV
jgi:hypothetical protein